MSFYETVEVTIPCRECGRRMDCRCLKESTRPATEPKPNLTLRCPVHGETPVELRRGSDAREGSWVYRTEDGHMLGRGTTPQGAIDQYHKEAGRDDRKHRIQHAANRAAESGVDSTDAGDDPEPARKIRIQGLVSRPTEKLLGHEKQRRGVKRSRGADPIDEA